MKCIILCAGKGTRIYPYSEKISKVMVEVNGKPLLEYVIDYWKKFTNDFIFIVGFKKQQIIEYVQTLDIKAEFIEQKQLKGIADAIYLVKNHVTDDFVVVLGDCFYNGTFNVPQTLKLGIGVYETKNHSMTRLNYSIELENALITRVVEKPTYIPNDYCGMGVYFFDSRVFAYIKKTSSSYLRGEIEITDVIQTMINEGEQIHPIFFNGDKYLKAWGKILWPISKKMLQMRAKIVSKSILPHIQKNDHVLSLGCGKNIHNLFVTTYLSQKNKIHLTAIDIVPHDIDNITIVTYEGGHLPFVDNSFDIVFSSIALHHLDNPDFYLYELVRISQKKILVFEDTYNNMFEKFMAKSVCLLSDVLVGDIVLRRSFKSLDEWEKILSQLKIKNWSIKRYYPHPLPWIPTRNIIIEINK